MTLSPDEIENSLQTLPNWTLHEDTIRREYSHASFRDAIAFVNRVAQLSEAADHHPDIEIRFKRVTLSLSTHSASGLTSRDFDLARQIDAASTRNTK